jgi:predicted metal-dependent TIM-barrel fold hydrolase
MAFDAFAFQHDLMHALCLRQKHLIVALVADVAGLGRQKLRIIGGVRVVAAGAFAFSQWRMDEAFPQDFLEPIVAGDAEISPGAGLQSQLALGVHCRHREDHEQEAQ